MEGVSVLIFTIALLVLPYGNCEDRDEVVFFEDSQFNGDRMFLSLAPGCYNFESDWNNRVSSVDTQGHCIIAWDQANCQGPSVKLAPGVRGLGDLKRMSFDNMISAITVCSDRTSTLRATKSDRGGPEIFRIALAEHNNYRRMHAVPDLIGDMQLHEAAQKHADYLARSNKFETSTNNFGENLATSYKTDKEEAIHDVVKRWYDKIEFYDFQNPESNKNRPRSGQFSSIVWKSTTHMGIGMAWNDHDHKWVIVATYDPAAKQKDYRENVLPASKKIQVVESPAVNYRRKA